MATSRQQSDQLIEKSLKPECLPRHVAIIMDGNGRWAKERGRPRVFGHTNGVESVRSVVRTAGELGIKALTLYAFSEENWGRPIDEVSAIMTLLNTYIVKERKELDENNVRFQTIGKISRLSDKSQRLIRETREYLQGNTGLILTVALSYGGRSEIVEATRNIARQVAEGTLKAEDIDQDTVAANLMTNDLPDPDLVIRTSGEQRISNFLLWQAAYAELYFTQTFWPDFRRPQFIEALLAYQDRQRRFGVLPVENMGKNSSKEAPAVNRSDSSC